MTLGYLYTGHQSLSGRDGDAITPQLLSSRPFEDSRKWVIASLPNQMHNKMGQRHKPAIFPLIPPTPIFSQFSPGSSHLRTSTKQHCRLGQQVPPADRNLAGSF